MNVSPCSLGFVCAQFFPFGRSFFVTHMTWLLIFLRRFLQRGTRHIVLQSKQLESRGRANLVHCSAAVEAFVDGLWVEEVRCEPLPAGGVRELGVPFGPKSQQLQTICLWSQFRDSFVVAEKKGTLVSRITLWSKVCL